MASSKDLGKKHENNGENQPIIVSHFNKKDREFLETLLREKEEDYRTLVETSSDMIFRLDLEGHLSYYNDICIKTSGYSRKELKESSLEKLIHPEDLSDAMTSFNQARKGASIKNIEFRIRKKNGDYYYLSINLTPIFTLEGVIKGFLGIGRDITEKKRMESALRKSEARYRTLIENNIDTICYLDNENQIKYLSPQFYDMTKHKNIDKANYLKYIHEDDHPIILNQLKKKNKQGIIKFRVIKANGEYIWVATHIKEYNNEYGESNGYLLIIRNIDELERLLRFWKSDVRNLLHTFGNLSELLKYYKEDEAEKFQSILDILDSQIEKGKHLLKEYEGLQKEIEN